MAKKVDLKAKAKRQKIVAGVLGVLFLGVVAFMGPKTLKQLTGPKVDPLRAAQAASTTTPTGAVPLTPPSLGGSATPAPTGSEAQLAAAAPTPASLDQLTSFSRFESKDPFIQQVTPGSSGSTPPSVTPSSGGSHSTSGGGSQPTQPVPTPKPKPVPKPPVVPPTAAVISVNNGPAQLIQTGQDFPQAPYEAIFRLVSLRPGVARIAISGGSYTSGAATVTLKTGKPLTLENTADGTRYVLKLLWTGAGQPPPRLLPTATTPSSATATPPAATTTTAAP